MGRLALLRLIAQWRALLTVIVGVLLAGIIGANAPLYTAAVAQIGMVDRLQDQPPDRVNLFTRVTVTGAQTTDIDAAWQTLDADLHALL
ncbi:MAG: hypothetical protein IAE80_01865, partial [Anaerolinea sp.]|nr:hypothetical protein [Anaerolinea sp.]